MHTYIAASLLALIALSLSAHAETIAATPETIVQVLARVNPGDTVVLADGVYKGDHRLTRSGREGAPIVIRGQGGAVFDGGDTCLWLEGASWVTVENVRFQNATTAGMRVRMGPLPDAEHVTVRDCVFADNRKWGIITSHVNHFTIEDCEAFGATIEHGIYVANSGDDNVIRNNRIHHNAGNGIHMNGDPSCGGDGVMSRLLCEGNVVYENGTKGGSGLSIMHVQDSIFRNNLLYDNHAGGIVLFWYVGDEKTQSSKNNVIANNTVYYPPGQGRSCLLMRNTATGNRVENNIFVGGQRGTVFIEPSCLPGLVMDHNVIANYDGVRLIGDSQTSAARTEGTEVVRPVDEWTAAGFSPDTSNGTLVPVDEWLAHGYDAHSAFGKMPQFVDAAKGDFRLAPGSVGIDMGANLAELVKTDILGVPRPQGKAFDCGCYEAK